MNSVSEKQDALLLRADLLQQVHGLELQRAAILSQIARIEKKFDIQKGVNNGRTKNITENNSSQGRADITAAPQSMLPIE